MGVGVAVELNLYGSTITNELVVLTNPDANPTALIVSPEYIKVIDLGITAPTDV